MDQIISVPPLPRILAGPGLLQTLRDEIPRNTGARRLVVVTDAGVRAAGLADQVAEALGDLVAGIFDGCVENAEEPTVQKLAAMAVAVDADGLVAVGGGSVMDTAKAANLLVTLGGDSVIAHYRARPVGHLKLQVIAVPTTAGTGSEVSFGAVVKDPVRGIKFGLGGAFLVPDMAVLVPELTVGLPPRWTAATGFDALTHAVEAYVSTRRNPFASGVALEAVRLVARWLPHVMQHPKDLHGRGQMLAAATLGAVAFNSALLGAAHAIAHALGGRHGVPHGVANAIALPAVMRFNLAACPERYADLARAMGHSDAVPAVEQLRQALGLPTRLSELGVEPTPELVKAVLADPFIRQNPRPATEADVAGLLEEIR